MSASRESLQALMSFGGYVITTPDIGEYVAPGPPFDLPVASPVVFSLNEIEDIGFQWNDFQGVENMEGRYFVQDSDGNYTTADDNVAAGGDVVTSTTARTPEVHGGSRFGDLLLMQDSQLIADLPDSIDTDVERNILYDFKFNTEDLPSDLQFSQSSLLIPSQDGDNVACDSSQVDGSNDNPLGSEAICFDQYEGEFKFTVRPSENGKSKCVYDEEKRKFYCSLATYEFSINMDWYKILNPARYQIRMALVYTDPQYQNVKPTKCFNCTETQRKTWDASSPPEMLNYIVRAGVADPYVTYRTSEATQRDYMMIAVRNPEPGSASLSQKILFTCHTSCKSADNLGMNRRLTALVFTLLNEAKEICGRAVVHVRICSAPLRDYKEDKKKEVKMQKDMDKEKDKETKKAKRKISDGTDKFPAIVKRRRSECVDKAGPSGQENGSQSEFDSDAEFQRQFVDSSQESGQESSQEFVFDRHDGNGPQVLRLTETFKWMKRGLRWIQSSNAVTKFHVLSLAESLSNIQTIVGATKVAIKSGHLQKKQMQQLAGMVAEAGLLGMQNQENAGLEEDDNRN